MVFFLEGEGGGGGGVVVRLFRVVGVGIFCCCLFSLYFL